ncbi:MAG: polymer-forming cytoskeletal protein [Desulfobacteraceae bacterium]|nr:polymer-forming cytoskeletal protein [Desulfobacteraceae bacterium]
MKKIKEQINAFLGKDTEFEGKLSFTGAVRIDGRFKGDIFTKGTLIIGETAIVEAQIHASYIIISGEVRGNIIAENRIEIHQPGKVFGNIQAPVVTIDEGVIFEGNCQMRKLSAEADKKVAVLSK